MNLNKSIVKLSGCACLITLFAGCASVICGPRQTVAIDSKPSGAEVMVYDAAGDVVFKNTTPCVATLDRRTADYERASYVILVKREGYAPVQIPLAGRVNKAYFANILFGGIGLVVDPLTGSMWTLTPNDIDAKLISENTAFFHGKEGLMICLREQVPSGLEPYLKPLQN